MLKNMPEESMRPDGISYNVAISILLAKFSKRVGVARGILRQDSVSREKGFWEKPLTQSKKFQQHSLAITPPCKVYEKKQLGHMQWKAQ